MPSDNELTTHSTVYLVLTTAGKPVFSSIGSEQDVLECCSVIQAIMSCFEGHNELKTIKSKGCLWSIMKIDPLILVCIDKRGVSPHVLRVHLNLLNAQILSVLTSQQLLNQMRVKPNVDLRPFLAGTEVFMLSLCRCFRDSAPWTWLNSLETFTMSLKQRLEINKELLECRNEGVLYGIVLKDRKFVSIMRPKQHSLHPIDLHLVVNMLFNTGKFKEGEHWVPICFPRFNPNGFLYAYIRRLGGGYVVLVSASKLKFYELQESANKLHSRLQNTDTSLDESVHGTGVLDTVVPSSDVPSSGVPDVPVDDVDDTNVPSTGVLGVPGVHVDVGNAPDAPSGASNGTSSDVPDGTSDYFIFKSKTHVQYVKSNVDNTTRDTQFALLNSEMRQTRSRVICKPEQHLLAWSTPNFELYLYSTVKDIDKQARKIANEIMNNQDTYFLLEGAVF